MIAISSNLWSGSLFGGIPASCDKKKVHVFEVQPFRLSEQAIAEYAFLFGTESLASFQKFNAAGASLDVITSNSVPQKD
jgi:hypothetical protein